MLDKLQIFITGVGFGSLLMALGVLIGTKITAVKTVRVKAVLPQKEAAKPKKIRRVRILTPPYPKTTTYVAMLRVLIEELNGVKAAADFSGLGRKSVHRWLSEGVDPTHKDIRKKIREAYKIVIEEANARYYAEEGQQ